MNDREFLIWLHARLEKVHGEDPSVDYMRKLRAIIQATTEDQLTPNVECIAAAHLNPGEYQYVTNPQDGTVTLLLGREGVSC